MKRRLIIGLIVAAVSLPIIALGGWLWLRNGLAVWIDAAIAFCM